MSTVTLIIATIVWCALSVPTALLVGQLLRRESRVGGSQARVDPASLARQAQ